MHAIIMHTIERLIKLLESECREFSFFGAECASERAGQLVQQASQASLDHEEKTVWEKSDEKMQARLLARACLFFALEKLEPGSGTWLSLQSRGKPLLYPAASISHCTGAAVAVVAPKAFIQHIGIDIERSDRNTGPGLLARICDAEQAQALSRAWKKSSDILAFSAKEAAYKALPQEFQKFFPLPRIQIIPKEHQGCIMTGEVFCEHGELRIGGSVFLVQESPFVLAFAKLFPH